MCRCPPQGPSAAGPPGQVSRQPAHLEPIIGPRTKLHVTVLVVEGEPGDVDLAGGLEDARGDVEHGAVLGDHDVRLERPVESFIGAARLLGMASCKAEGVARLGYFYCYFFY